MYADFWLAYRLTFDTDERIIAAQNKFTKLTFEGGQAVASRHPFIRYPPYERKVEAAAMASSSSASRSNKAPTDLPGRGEARVRELARFVARLRAGYRASIVGPFVVYSLPT